MRFPSLLEIGDDQRKVVELPFRGSHVVTGAPGGGKTVTAVYRAWALATVGREVVLLTRYNLLHQYIAQLAPELTGSPRVTTTARWLNALWREKFGSDPPRSAEDERRYDWVEMQRSCILQGVTVTASLVVDEGQNLPPGFYRLCRLLKADVTVFADENQPIGTEESTLSEVCRILGAPAAPLELRHDHRSSREIAVLASEFRMESRTRFLLPKRSGNLPVVMRTHSLDGLLTGIAQYFNAHQDRSIGIICRSGRMIREIQGGLASRGLAKKTQAYVFDDRYRNSMDFSTHPIRIVSTASVKGLEFDSVFVPDLDSYTEDPTGVEARLRFLVLCTRAREDLHFAHRGTDEPPITAAIPEALLARHHG
ncbi:DNA helicase [Streptomyces sp. DH12]|uniref:DNA helicase n=1 Tax=Streptomyces sp. DH12 TaxID=2857010 RepID=UPI001E610000|nr:DNA helicase [Streptomyces sp. DH12]